jgi:hypothetical protein
VPRPVAQALGTDLSTKQDALLQQRGRAAVVVAEPSLKISEQAR